MNLSNIRIYALYGFMDFSPLCHFAPWTFRPLDDSPPRRFATWTIRPRQWTIQLYFSLPEHRTGNRPLCGPNGPGGESSRGRNVQVAKRLGGEWSRGRNVQGMNWQSGEKSRYYCMLSCRCECQIFRYF